MPDFDIRFAVGPSVKKVSRAEAIKAIQKNPQFPKGAKVVVDEVEGHWVAAVAIAGPPFGGGGPADAEEEAPSPKSEGPDDVEPSEDHEAPDEGGEEDGGGEKPPFGKEDGKDGESKGKGGEEHLLVTIHDALQKILIALGIPDAEAPGASPVPGLDGPPAPPGPGGPPGGPGGPQEVKHERALKPGEVAPGGTPVGAPAFAHVHPDFRERIANHPITKKFGHHPWESIVGRKATFVVAERVDENLSADQMDHELQQVAHGTGYKLKQLHDGRNEQGHRVARALISAR